MKETRFTTIIGDDRVIRLPDDFPPITGEAEVIVIHHPAQPGSSAPPRRPIHERLARAAEELGVRDLPSDLAANHDHYAHGAPRGIDER